MSFNINKDKKECDHKDNNGTDDGPESLPPDFQFPVSSFIFIFIIIVARSMNSFFFSLLNK